MAARRSCRPDTVEQEEFENEQHAARAALGQDGGGALGGVLNTTRGVREHQGLAAAQESNGAAAIRWTIRRNAHDPARAMPGQRPWFDHRPRPPLATPVALLRAGV